VSLKQVALLAVFSSIIISKCVFSQDLIVLTEDWPPYSYQNRQGDIVGTATTRVKNALDLAGVSYQIHLYPWTRSFKLASRNKNTLIYSIFRTKEREDNFQWICPITKPIEHQLFKLAARTDIHINQFDDLKQYVLGLLRDTYPHQYFTQEGLKENVHLDIMVEEDLNLKRLITGRIDLLADEEAPLLLRLEKLGYDSNLIERVYTIQSDDAPENCMAFSITTPRLLVEKVRKAMQQVLAEEVKKGD